MNHMNVYFRELKAHKKSVIGWSVGMFALVGSGMAKYSAYQGSGQSMTELFEQFPKTVRVVLGFSDLDLSTVIGFYGVLFLYIAVMISIHATLLGANIISKEERDRTSEFLFVKPISRSKIITQKLLAALTDIIIVNIVTLVSSIVMVGLYSNDPEINHTVYLLMFGAFLMQIFFLSIGMAIASISKKPKSSASFAAGILMLTFVFGIAVDLNNNLDILRYMTPFKYFDAKSIIPSNDIGIQFIFLSVIISIAAIAVTYFSYSRRDLSV